jgi:hypothetical protein
LKPDTTSVGLKLKGVRLKPDRRSQT